MNLVLDMTNLSGGGSISILLRYLQEWEKTKDLKITVFYSRELIRKELESAHFSNVRLIGVCQGKSSLCIFLYRTFLLSRQIKAVKGNVVYCVNSRVGFCNVAQLVHMRNLQHFSNRSVLATLLQGNFYEALRDYVCRRSVRKASLCVYVSNYLRNAASPWQKKRDSERHIVIWNPVSDKQLQAGRTLTREDIDHHFNSSLILSVLNDCPHKDVPAFLKTLTLLRTREPKRNWHGVILGTGNWSHYDALIKEYDLCSAIDFPGYIPASQIDQYYNHAFCLLSTSRLEGFNNTPLEAMANGCPVVITDCCAHPEVVGNAARLFPVGDANAAAQKIFELAQDIQLYSSLCEAGKKNIERFKLADSAADLLNALQQIRKK